MKPILKNGWIFTEAVFVPTQITEDVWRDMTIEQRVPEIDWCAYRFLPQKVESYYRGIYPKTTVVKFRESTFQALSRSVEDFDAIFQSLTQVQG